jgi:hypothetical protein
MAIISFLVLLDGLDLVEFDLLGNVASNKSMLLAEGDTK